VLGVLRTVLEGSEWQAREHLFSSVVGQERYQLPADFDTLLGVRGDVGSSDEFSLRQWDYADLAALNGVGVGGGCATHYRLIDVDGQAVRLKPTPQTVDAMALDYTPAYVELVADRNVTFSMPFGWWKWAALLAAIDLRAKEGLDSPTLSARWQALDERVKRRAPRRDRANAPRIRDTRRDLSVAGGLPRLWRSS
jgi:hypothetical protein